MGKTLSIILVVLAILVVAGGLFFAGSLYGRWALIGRGMLVGYGSNTSTGYGAGMMNGGYGPGMMGGRGQGMMGGYVQPGAANAGASPLTVDQAKAAAEAYLTRLNNSDLKLAEIMLFDNNAYIAVKEGSTGLGAFELLVDPSSRVAYPEFGPNMMWNQKYGGPNHQYMMGGGGYGMMGGNGMMGGRGQGMMGGWANQDVVPGNVPTSMPVTKDQATKAAQAYLDRNIAGATAADDPMQFYGYYTLDFEKDGKVAGMLSVNGYSGQIFLHTWHGSFIQEAALQ